MAGSSSLSVSVTADETCMSGSCRRNLEVDGPQDTRRRIENSLADIHAKSCTMASTCGAKFGCNYAGEADARPELHDTLAVKQASVLGKELGEENGGGPHEQTVIARLQLTDVNIENKRCMGRPTAFLTIFVSGERRRLEADDAQHLCRNLAAPLPPHSLLRCSKQRTPRDVGAV